MVVTSESKLDEATVVRARSVFSLVSVMEEVVVEVKEDEGVVINGEGVELKEGTVVEAGAGNSEEPPELLSSFISPEKLRSKSDIVVVLKNKNKNKIYARVKH